MSCNFIQIALKIHKIDSTIALDEMVAMKNIQVRVEDIRRRIMDKKEVKNRFSFRKLSTGLATVFLGSIFFWTNGQTVQADSVEPASGQAVQNVDSQAQADNTVSENTVNEENGSTSETTTEVKTEMSSVDTTPQAKDVVETSDNKKVELPQGEADKQAPQKLEVNKSNQAAETTDKDTNTTSAIPAQLNEIKLS